MPATAYPTHAEYNLAVKYTSRFVLDPVLKLGTPRSRTSVPVAKGGRPLTFAGGFAKVYIFDCGSKRYALRVWLVEIPEVAARYQVTSDFLRQHQLPFFVEFEFVKNGILVSGKKYPDLRMEWADGLSLRDFIIQNRSRPEIIKAAADEFFAMSNALHEANIAHGDLQADNMIFRINSGSVSCKLIDYDTLVVPDLIGKPVSSTGLTSYQHPKRADSPAATKKDDFFSELVIYICLLAIAENPKLWDDFPEKGRDKELLFQGADYRSPKPSPLFRELYGMGGLIQKLAVILWNFSRCPSINDLIPLKNVLEIATKPATHVPTPANNAPAATQFSRRLAAMLSKAQPSGSDAWLDDSAFSGGKVFTPVKLQRRRGHSTPVGTSKSSFAEILVDMQPVGGHPPTPPGPNQVGSGFQNLLTTMIRQPQPTPAPKPVLQPSTVNRPLLVAAAVVVALIAVFYYLQNNTTPMQTPPLRPSFSPPPTPTQNIRASTPSFEESSNTPSGIEASPVPLESDTTTPEPEPSIPTYHVVKVAQKDFLNLRSGPGSDYPVVRRIYPNAAGIKLLEHRYRNGDTIWQEIILTDGYSGYVNADYLEEDR